MIAFFGFPPSSLKPTSNISTTETLAAADKTENEDFPKVTMFNTTSNAGSKGNLPVQASKPDKALYVTPCKPLRDRMSYDMTSAEARLEKSESCSKILRQDVEKALSKIKELESNFESLRIEKESLSKQLENTQSEKARLTQLCERLKAQKMSNSIKSQAATDSLGVKIGDSNIKISNLKGELTKTRKAHAAQINQLETSKKELDVMKSENAALQEKLSGIQTKSAATIDLKEAQVTINKLQKKHGEMKMEIGQLKADKGGLEEKILRENNQIERANMEREKVIVERNDAIAERWSNCAEK